MPDLHFENLYGRASGKTVCGADEVGRGPLAGPVMAAAVILPEGALPAAIEPLIRDSKKLSLRQREKVFPFLTAHCRYAVAQCSVQEIDSLNILHAAMLAMRRAIDALDPAPDFALIDGNRIPPDLPCPAKPLVKGDDKSLSIAAASIIAKVTRDRLMTELAEKHPGYGWEKNAGYGTAAHLAALKKLGPCQWHRTSFSPVARIIMVNGA